MGVDITFLVAEWEPTVAAYRESRGMGFYWDRTGAPAPPPFAVERRFSPGRHLLDAGDFYTWLRPSLPPELRDEADAFLGMLWGGYAETPLTRPDDLRTDAGRSRRPAPADRSVWYSMRPETVRRALARAERVSWDEVEIAGLLLPDGAPMDSDYFRHFVVGKQREWLTEAAERDHGAVLLLALNHRVLH